MEPEELVSEMFIRFSSLRHVEWNDREDFFALAARIMRRVLVDSAHARVAGRRAAPFVPPRRDVLSRIQTHQTNLIALEEALTRLASTNKRQAQVVELRFFGGLTSDETAGVLNISQDKVEREWKYAKKKLVALLGDPERRGPPRSTGRPERPRDTGREAQVGFKQARFTAYHLRSIDERAWRLLLAYVHVTDAERAVEADAHRRFGEDSDGISSKVARTDACIARGTKILVVPESDALELNPPFAAVTLIEDFHCTEFRVRLRDQPVRGRPRTATVRIGFYVPPLLIAEIAVTMRIERDRAEAPARSSAAPYQRVFVSYSHDDSDIANQLEKAYTAIGIEYMRDIRFLRSGQKWTPELLNKIDKAEVFQLLWSHAARRSDYVTKEWRYALTLQREWFIRPVYWERPMPPAPDELSDIHFAYLELRPPQKQ
jgi:RNA polymerase sigma factor (TIGR02999 family)